LEIQAFLKENIGQVHKDRKQKSSPIRTTKISGKNQMGVTHYFTNKSKGERSKNRHTNQNSTYKEPIHQHANLLKAHNLNLSFNNYKTEMRLPNRQKFVADTQLVKSPFLSKTLKGMMQPKAKRTRVVNMDLLATPSLRRV